ncbi:hypothetical protein [Gracilimonas amylolytica]|uniref:hypothetical protein n=1 Tax=Gracilimonas amylolytica TaxID=1749045 RepID=UPI000CD81E7E|nr:hypothetical protein [Gracilimonas amylolytica]
MNWIWLLIISYAIMELSINLAFHFIIRWLKNSSDSKVQRRREVFKGVLERLFLVTGLLTGFPHVIIAFGALKIGTRFQKNNKVSNDYFLIGNFISLLAAILFVVITRALIL